MKGVDTTQLHDVNHFPLVVHWQIWLGPRNTLSFGHVRFLLKLFCITAFFLKENTDAGASRVSGRGCMLHMETATLSITSSYTSQMF